MNNHPLMLCGCAAMAETPEGKPVCPVHIGLHPGAEIVAPNQPTLEGRQAKCHCGNQKPSSATLPFFTHQPAKTHDNYYCGCDGWD